MWDVVVVGGGIGGLAAGALLARAGQTVLVLEKSAHLGGACRGFTENGHRYDLGMGVITGAGPGGAVAALCDRLGISLPAIPCDPAVQVALPRHRLDLSPASERWWSEIRREFPDDETGWHALVSDLASLVRVCNELRQRLAPCPPDGWREHLRRRRILTSWRLSGTTRQGARQLRKAAETPFRATVADYGLGTASRQALEACLWYLLTRDLDECSTLDAALALHELREGVAVISDGPSILVDLLAQRIQECGGEIRVETEAARCLAERGRIVGVTTAAGETLRSRWVVTDVAPGLLMRDLLPPSRGWFRRSRALPGPWEPRTVTQVMGITIPNAFLPSELGWHCLVVADSGGPARDGNVVFIQRMEDAGQESAGAGLARLSVGRFVPALAPQDEDKVTGTLLEALDRVIPGVGRLVVHQRFVPSSVLGELWGRPLAAIRYTVDSRAWLGRRGSAHQFGWPGLLAVGDWTQPGRLTGDVVKGAMHVVDRIMGADG